LTTQADIFRKLFPTYINHKIILGIGGLSFENDSVIEEAKKQGIGVIKIVSDMVEYHTENIKKF
jgi:hypothetical protein